MAGLSAAARARELGAEPVILEKGDRPGGSMLLSSCVIWRHRRFEDFRAECPGGDEVLQRTVFDRLDEALDWLESLGARVTGRDTGNPRTVGRRFDPSSLTDALVRAAGHVQLRRSGVRHVSDTGSCLVLATGGFPARLAREKGLLLRANRWSEGDALDFALARNASVAGDLDEFYGRAMPAVDSIGESDFVLLTQLYGRYASVTSEDGAQTSDGEPSWSEADLVQQIARWPGGSAWYTVEPTLLHERVRERTVAEMVELARAAGAPVREERGRVSILVRAAVTQTLGGLRIDEHARVLGADGLYAAGADVGGIATGGYSSGLASALVFGLIAAESALS
jgi:succinate dehydrogenase/fumarate reductase flavoprotein subunit